MAFNQKYAVGALQKIVIMRSLRGRIIEKARVR